MQSYVSNEVLHFLSFGDWLGIMVINQANSHCYSNSLWISIIPEFNSSIKDQPVQKPWNGKTIIHVIYTRTL